MSAALISSIWASVAASLNLKSTMCLTGIFGPGNPKFHSKVISLLKCHKEGLFLSKGAFPTLMTKCRDYEYRVSRAEITFAVYSQSPLARRSPWNRAVKSQYKVRIPGEGNLVSLRLKMSNTQPLPETRDDRLIQHAGVATSFGFCGEDDHQNDAFACQPSEPETLCEAKPEDLLSWGNRLRQLPPLEQACACPFQAAVARDVTKVTSVLDKGNLHGFVCDDGGSEQPKPKKAKTAEVFNDKPCSPTAVSVSPLGWFEDYTGTWPSAGDA